jgi:hypothetical protein
MSPTASPTNLPTQRPNVVDIQKNIQSSMVSGSLTYVYPIYEFISYCDLLGVYCNICIKVCIYKSSALSSSNDFIFLCTCRQLLV